MSERKNMTNRINSNKIFTKNITFITLFSWFCFIQNSEATISTYISSASSKFSTFNSVFTANVNHLVSSMLSPIKNGEKKIKSIPDLEAQENSALKPSSPLIQNKCEINSQYSEDLNLTNIPKTTAPSSELTLDDSSVSAQSACNSNLLQNETDPHMCVIDMDKLIEEMNRNF